MSMTLGGTNPAVTFPDGTIQNSAFNGTSLSASPYTTSLGANTLVNNTGTSNTAVGNGALQANTTASNNTAVGYQAGYSNTTGTSNNYFGYVSGYSNTVGSGNNFFGYFSGFNNTASNNSGFGQQTLQNNTTGTANSAFGQSALFSNTTASNNTAVGYQAGYSNQTGANNVFVGYQSGYNANTSGGHTFVGYNAGLNSNSSSTANTFFGNGAGSLVTSGIKNTVIGRYDGNTGGLDIRTASNYIVLSDGDGNPRGIFDGSGNFSVGNTTASLTPTNGICVAPTGAGGGGTIGIGHISGTPTGNYYMAFAYNAGAIGSITQTGTTAVLFNTTSDYRLKNDVAPLENALATIEALNPVSFTWIDGRKDDGFLAHELQAVIPNCVTGEKDAVNEDGTPKYQQMDNSGVIPFLVKAIQEQQAIIEQLKAKVGL